MLVNIKNPILDFVYEYKAKQKQSVLFKIHFLISAFAVLWPGI